MHINNIPTELFVKILEYIPFRDSSTIIRVNKEWYKEYRASIQRQYLAKFKELLYSHWSEWDIPIRLIRYCNWHEFLLDKLHSFNENFGECCVNCVLLDIYESLRLEMKTIDRERDVIDNLMNIYKEKEDFEGLFPNWLWEKHKNNRHNSGTNFVHYNLVYALKRKLAEDHWTYDHTLFH